MAKRWFCLMLCIALLLFQTPMAFAEEAAETGPVRITISSLEEFLTFAENCRLDQFSMNLEVTLTADIDLTGTVFEPVPIFCGTFLGGGHQITGLNITGKGSQQGLFRYLAETARVEELHVSGEVAPQGSRSEVGGIAGSNAGVILNCSFTGTVSGGDRVGGIAGTNTVSGIIQGCSTAGDFHGNHFVGGMAGESAGTIRECENSASINTTPQQNTVDIEDVTMDTLMGTESTATVTDIGGIAGAGSGMIRGCINRGTVGYRHMGYNIGGIAGSLTGYLEGCENYGDVSGRKDVGGIVGQMEPAVLLHYETDTLQILRSELAVLRDLMDRASLNAQSNSQTIQDLIDSLEYYTWRAESAIDILTIDPEDPQIHDPDTYIAALQTLESSLSSMTYAMRRLAQAVKDTGEDLSADLEEVSDQVDVIAGILDNGEAHLGGTVEDVSDGDTPEDLTSKIVSAVNHGGVLGDMNVGGVAGAMALENDLDPEGDVDIYGETTLNASGRLRSVVLDTQNNGTVTVKRQNAGGIVGWQSMGLIKNCVNLGDLEASEASYVGGIAGRSNGYIRLSGAKCTISGDSRLGGIAGSGATVTGSCAMVRIQGGSEKLGAIVGTVWENGTVEGNHYLVIDGDLGAIDGISYAGSAEALELDDFLGLENLPESFRIVTVRFRFADGTEEAITLTPGGSLDPAKIPAVPAKENHTGEWKNLDQADLDHILFDLTFETEYRAYSAVIQSTECRENGLPIILAEGAFTDAAVISASRSEQALMLAEGEELLESWSVSLTEAGHTLHLLLPEGTDTRYLKLMIWENGTWSEVGFREDGSYLVFDGGMETEALALILLPNPESLYWTAAAAGAVVLLAVWLLVRFLRKKKAAKAAAKS